MALVAAAIAESVDLERKESEGRKELPAADGAARLAVARGAGPRCAFWLGLFWPG